MESRWLESNYPYHSFDERAPGRFIDRYRVGRKKRHYVACLHCGNGARKWKHVQHRRSCPTHFVKMCEASEKAYGALT